VRRFAVFDIDGTLIRWQLYHATVDQLAKNGLISSKLKNEISNLRLKWKKREHEISFKEYERGLVKIFDSIVTNINPDIFDKTVIEVVDRYKDQVYTYTRDFIKKLKEDGYFLLAISGSQKELVKLIAEYYGFDDWAGSTYERQDNVFTGKKNVISKDKASVLNGFIKKHNLSFNDSYGFGDTESDTAFLEMVDRPIAFNPEINLYKYAKQNGWKIVIERKNVIYKLEPQNGRYILA
jgi:HAD superfamily hydrolase (TIGR01490 family)